MWTSLAERHTLRGESKPSCKNSPFHLHRRRSLPSHCPWTDTHTLNSTPKPLFWRRLNVSIDWSRPFGVRPLSRKRLRNLLRFPLRLSISPCTGWCRRNGFPRNGEAQTLPKPYWVLGVQAPPQPPARINLCRKITFNCSPNARTAPAPGISFPLGWF